MDVAAPPSSSFAPIRPEEIAAPLADLGLEEEEFRESEGRRAALLLDVPPGVSTGLAGEVRDVVRTRLAPAGALLLFLEGRRSEGELAAWRNELWPLLHVGAHYRVSMEGVTRRTLSGEVLLPGSERKARLVRSGVLVVARLTAHALSPSATVEKFDANAGGWNGEPGGAGYPHFRWMRRFVGCFAELPRDARLLDFGCGAGWCGIEAARRFGARSLRFFDPSPEMVRIATENARATGLEDARGATGFGEAPPFPEDGEEPYDAVISSGVVSFSPDFDAWFEGLARTVRPGGQLVIGDIQRTSRGMRRRRREKALLPARELNALTATEARARLEALGFVHRGGAGYQLTRPFPEAAHVNETRLGGALTYPLLWSNRLAATTNRVAGIPGADQFDSWVMHFSRGAD